MRKNKLPPFRLSKSSSSDLYWTPSQLIAHHTSNGCNLQTGDILATGTISGPTPKPPGGCLLELTRNGTQPIALPTGETRTYLADGDEIVLQGSCTLPHHPVSSSRRMPRHHPPPTTLIILTAPAEHRSCCCLPLANITAQSISSTLRQIDRENHSWPHPQQLPPTRSPRTTSSPSKAPTTSSIT